MQVFIVCITISLGEPMKVLAWIVLVLIHVLDIRLCKIGVTPVMHVDHVALHPCTDRLVLPVEYLHCCWDAVA